MVVLFNLSSMRTLGKLSEMDLDILPFFSCLLLAFLGHSPLDHHLWLSHKFGTMGQSMIEINHLRVNSIGLGRFSSSDGIHELVIGSPHVIVVALVALESFLSFVTERIQLLEVSMKGLFNHSMSSVVGKILHSILKLTLIFFESLSTCFINSPLRQSLENRLVNTSSKTQKCSNTKLHIKILK